ncbi:hypothetical protein [Marinigracilibium pacificum]|uniref:Ig-like domain-containing protein n=1 Tax=Marinigracilibium pacificum TaxID=2729599 RepID=A0A848IZM9_9BACT|nr:hypothetical protein [Marinigracilibium pacificum]NMM47750.1 hypothetical protein [Marinigracilibium pacificum]
MTIFKRYFLLLSLALGFSLFFSCQEKEVLKQQLCDGSEYKVSYVSFTYISVTEFTYYVYAPENKTIFDKDITVKYYVQGSSTPNRKMIIPAGTSSPAQFHNFQTINGDHPKNINIVTSDCPEGIEKPEEEIINEDENPDCTKKVSIKIKKCEDQVFLDWTTNLSSSVILNVYGKNILITQDHGLSYNISDLSINDSIPTLLDSDACLYTIRKSCTGTTGILSISEMIEGGQELIISVTDPDLNSDESSVESVTVEVNSSLGEKELVVLTETSESSNEFSGVLLTTLGSEAGTDNDNNLNIENGTIITVTYQDEKNGNDVSVANEKTVVASGDTAPNNYSVVYAGNTYFLEADSYNIFDFQEPHSILFSIDDGLNTFFLSIEIYYQGTELTSGTYVVGGQDQGVNTETSGVNVGTDPSNYKSFTGGTVVVTVQQDGYLLEMNLEEGNNTLVGSYFVSTIR